MRSGDRSFWVWAEALDLLRGGEQLQRRFLTLATLQSLPCWAPSVDVYEDGDEIRVLVALPGVNSRQVEVVLDETELVVRGERPMPSTSHRTAIHRLEIPYGKFERRVALPLGEFRAHQQFLEDGCLLLVLRQP